MNLRTLPLLLALLFTAAAAHAQVGIYGTVTAARLENIAYTSGTTTVTNAQINPIGGTVGAYYDFKNLGPVRIGFDARGTVVRANRSAFPQSNAFGSRINSFEGGLRANIHVPWVIFHPYVEGTAGYARTNYGVQYDLVGAVTYHVYAGLDIKIFPLLDFRAFEFGIGALSGSTTSRTYPEGSISSGVVFHLPF